MEKYFEILGLSTDADEVTIKKAFKELAKKYHPDQNNKDANEEKFKDISEAYQKIIEFRVNNPTTNDFTNSNSKNNREPNFYEQRSKLKKQKQSAEEQLKHYNKDLRDINSDINNSSYKSNTYTSEIKISLSEIIMKVENYFSRQIGSNNSSMVNRIFEKRRLASQEKILEQENLYLPELKDLEEKIKNYIEENHDEKIFQLKLKQEMIEFLNMICQKELTKFLKAVQTYQEKYEELKKLLNENNLKKEEIEKKIKEIQSTITSINEYINQIDNFYSNNPIAEFMDKVEFDYSDFVSRR